MNEVVPPARETWRGLFERAQQGFAKLAKSKLAWVLVAFFYFSLFILFFAGSIGVWETVASLFIPVFVALGLIFSKNNLN